MNQPPLPLIPGRRLSVDEQLLVNHVISYRRALRAEGTWIHCCNKHKKWNRECAETNLAVAEAKVAAVFA